MVDGFLSGNFQILIKELETYKQEELSDIQLYFDKMRQIILAEEKRQKDKINFSFEKVRSETISF